MPYPPIPRDEFGNPLPCVWDKVNKRWRVYEGLLEVNAEVKVDAKDIDVYLGTAQQGESGDDPWLVELDGAQLATEAKLEQVRGLLSGVATEAKLEQARALLQTIS